jgi:hypothetical protein
VSDLRLTDTDLAAIGAVFDRPIGLTSDRPSLAGLLDVAGLDALTSESAPEAIEAALVRLRESIGADTDRLTRETIRQTIRTRYPHVPARMVDAAVAPAPRTSSTPDPKIGPDSAPLSGAAVLLSDPEPWPTSVEGATLADETATTVRRYVVVTEAQARTIALWCGMSYLMDALSIAPILLITSATMRSGKTTLCLVVAAMTPRSILLSSVSAAVVYRLIEAHHPTLIGDEADTWLTDDKSELRGIVNAGHTRRTAVVARCEGDAHEVRLYSLWCPRVLAMIGKPAGTIRDRAIAIELRRRTAAELVERLRADRLEDDLSALRSRWQRWAHDHRAAVREADPEMPAGLHDRATDCWRPLVAIADLLGGEWPTLARQAAVELSGGIDDDAEIIVELLRDVADYLAEHDGEILPSEPLLEALVARPDRPWATWRHGRPMTERGLARLLGPLGIHAGRYRLPSGRRARGYRRDAWSDAMARYLPAQVAQWPDANENGPAAHIDKWASDPGRPTYETRDQARITEARPTWPHGSGGNGDLEEGDDAGVF